MTLSDIWRVGARGDYVLVHVPQKHYIVHTTMNAIKEALPSGDFIRVHRSHIVRLEDIVDVEEGSLVIGREVIPIGASYRPSLLARIDTI